MKWHTHLNALSLMFSMVVISICVMAILTTILGMTIWYDSSRGYTKEKINNVQCIVEYGTGNTYCPVAPVLNFDK